MFLIESDSKVVSQPHDRAGRTRTEGIVEHGPLHSLQPRYLTPRGTFVAHLQIIARSSTSHSRHCSYHASRRGRDNEISK